jgi:probable rRNA maturation factor
MLSFHWTVRKLPRYQRRMEAKLVGVAKALGVKEDDDASVFVCGDKRIRALNRRFRQVDETTDVLAFPCDEPSLVSGCDGVKLAAHKAPLLLGDIFVNLRQVERQARANGNSTVDEFAAVATHGLLHLMGFDHAKPADARRMLECEKRLFKLASIEVSQFGH